MPIIEIVTFTVSDAYAADPSIVKPALDYLVKIDGCLDVYTGVAEEDKKTFHLIVVWETLEHHRTLQNTPGYPQIIGLERAVDESGLKVNHVEFNRGFAHAFGAPITEILRIALKHGVEAATKVRLYELLEQGVAAKLDVINKYAPASWGQAVEDAEGFWFVCGWDSAKAHMDTIHANLADFAPFIGAITEIVDQTMFHVKFSKHT